jgi:3-oxoacyl-[acyl-carrier protein] reductase
VTAVSVAEFDTLCRVNTRAAWLVDREAARQLRDGGALVNLTTAATGAALRDYGLSAATQAAVAVLTQALALELGDRDISVNALCVDAAAGWPPVLVADEVAFLLTRTGHAVTGQVIPLADPSRRGATRT